MERLKKALIVVAVFLLGYWASTLVFGEEFRRAKTLDDAHSASCRVSVANARGTGSFIGVDEEKHRALILTNYHVVTNNSKATLDFWTNSVRQSVSGTVVGRFYDANIPYDFALISVDIDDLKRIDPPYLALGGRDAAPDADSYILSSGCPKGRFAQAWKGKVLGYYNGSTVMFQPGPVPGQSGSAIISEIDGELWITGVLTWLIGTEGSDESRGGAIPIANLYRAIQGRQSATGERLENLSPIPPDAVECGLATPYVIEISQDNCPPCVEAQKDIEELKKAGVDVRAYNVSTSQDGIEYARQYEVDATPTFIVCDSNGEEIKRFVGAGKAQEILSCVIQNMPRMEEPKVIKPEPPAKTESIPLPKFSVVEPQDFRNRTPVYDYADASFFDDSNQRWLNRGKRTEPPKAEEEPEEPEPEPEPDKPKLRDKIFGDAERGILNSAIDNAVKKIEKRIEEKYDEKVADIESRINALYKKWRVRVFIIFVFAVCIALVISDWIKKGIAALWELIKAFVMLEDDPDPEVKIEKVENDVQPDESKA